MNPNQPYTPPPAGSSPYDFITNPGQPTKKPLFGGNNSFKSRLIVVIGGAVILVILIAIIATLLSGGGSGNTTALKTMVAQQQELARVADLGATQAQDSNTRSLAITAKLSVTSQQQKLTAYLEERGIKLSKEELAAKNDPKTDEAFETAAASNRFDDTFNAELDKQLKEYVQALQDAYKNASNETSKALLSESFQSTAFILGLE